MIISLFPTRALHWSQRDKQHAGTRNDGHWFQETSPAASHFAPSSADSES